MAKRMLKSRLNILGSSMQKIAFDCKTESNLKTIGQSPTPIAETPSLFINAFVPIDPFDEVRELKLNHA